MDGDDVLVGEDEFDAASAHVDDEGWFVSVYLMVDLDRLVEEVGFFAWGDDFDFDLGFGFCCCDEL